MNLCGRSRVAEHIYGDWYILIPCGRAADPGANLCAFRNVTADQDEAYADVNIASCEANEVRDRWLKERAHQCQRTQCDVVFHFTCAVPL